MNVTIVSPFRDSAGMVPAYRGRAAALDYPAAQLRFVLVEGDSKDQTLNALVAWAIADERVKVVVRDTGKPHYSSVVNAERFWILATVFNAGLEAVDCEWSDYVLFLPSDVLYGPDLLTRLLAHGRDIIAPYVWQNGRFYDIWGFSRNGRDYAPFGREAVTETAPVRMDTVGCVMLSRIDVLKRGVRYTLEAVDRGYCELARALGFEVWADPTTHVWHGGFT